MKRPVSHAPQNVEVEGVHVRTYTYSATYVPLIQRIDLRLEVRPSVGFHFINLESSKPVSPRVVDNNGRLNVIHNLVHNAVRIFIVHKNSYLPLDYVFQCAPTASSMNTHLKSSQILHVHLKEDGGMTGGHAET